MIPDEQWMIRRRPKISWPNHPKRIAEDQNTKNAPKNPLIAKRVMPKRLYRPMANGNSEPKPCRNAERRSTGPTGDPRNTNSMVAAISSARMPDPALRVIATANGATSNQPPWKKRSEERREGE